MANTVSTSTAATALDTNLEPKMAIASDGTLFLLYYDGTEMVYRSAVSPYSTWSSATTLPTSGSTRFGGSIHYNAADNSIDVFYHINTGIVTYVKLSYSSGTNTWSNGIAQTIGTGAGGSSGEVIWGGKDQGGNLWCVFNVSNTTWSASYSTDGGTTWNVSITAASVGTGASVDQPSAVMVGKYLLVCYSNNAGQLAWRRLDTTGTLTAWSVQQTVNLGPNPDFYPGDLMSLAVDGNGKATFVMSGQTFNFGSGVWAKTYDPTADTWGADVHIGATGGGANPDFNGFVASNGTDLWAIYTHSASGTAASDALVMKKYTASSTTWDTNATTLEATVANYVNPTAVATSNTLYFAYVTGTATPWTISQDSIATSSLTTITKTSSPTTVALLLEQTHPSAPTTVALQGTLTHPSAPTTVALQSLNLTHPSAPTTVAIQSVDLTHPSSPTTVALLATFTHPSTPVTTALLVTTSHPSAPTTVALSGTFTHPVAPLTVSLSSLTHFVPTTAAIGSISVASVPLLIQMPGIHWTMIMGGDN